MEGGGQGDKTGRRRKKCPSKLLYIGSCVHIASRSSVQLTDLWSLEALSYLLVPFRQQSVLSFVSGWFSFSCHDSRWVSPSFRLGHLLFAVLLPNVVSGDSLTPVQFTSFDLLYWHLAPALPCRAWRCETPGDDDEPGVPPERESYTCLPPTLHWELPLNKSVSYSINLT